MLLPVMACSLRFTSGATTLGMLTARHHLPSKPVHPQLCDCRTTLQRCKNWTKRCAFSEKKGKPYGGKEQFLRSGCLKRERHRELDGELLPFSLAKARLTVVKQNAVIASKGPQGFLRPFLLWPPLPTRAHARPFFANSLRNCSFPP